MNDDTRKEAQPEVPGDSGAPLPAADRQASIERRRDALRRIGRTGAAVGAASPLAALATGGHRQWARKKYSTKKVHASISGCNSVVVSAQPTKECYGKPCDHYEYSVPSGCGGDGKFKDYFQCWGRKDSNGKSSGEWGCLFDKSITQLCRYHKDKPETVWITAYCNAAGLYSSCKFPYHTTEVKNFWTSDFETRSSAYNFFKNYMMHG